MQNALKHAFAGKTVLVTGHTGFKGSWLAIWLCELGANVIGYSLPPPTFPSNFALTQLSKQITHIEGDILNYANLKRVFEREKPEIVFHLAAQPLVIPSYDSPKETFEINAIGTVNLLEAARHCPYVKAMVMITTDKCYDNKEWIWGYRENDALGGHDPYSASKAMAELAIASYRKSFCHKAAPRIASARAGNVIGGGDFSAYRIVPDTMNALLEDRPVALRNPHSVRPWMHILDPLKGYLQLAKGLLEKGSDFAQAWNFGPLEQQNISVAALVDKAIEIWGTGCRIQTHVPEPNAEMHLLKLNWDKAANVLGWRPTYSWEDAIGQTIEWYKCYRTYLQNPHEVDFYEVCANQIEQYMDTGKLEKIPAKGNFVPVPVTVPEPLESLGSGTGTGTGTKLPLAKIAAGIQPQQMAAAAEIS